METREELIHKYADTCVTLRNAELSRGKEKVEEKSFMESLWDNKWSIAAGLIAVGGAAGTAYCYREEISDYLAQEDNVLKDIDKFLSTGTGKAITGVVTVGTTTAIKSSFTSNQPTILRKISDSDLTPEFNYYRKLNPFTMSETELVYNITLMEGIIGSYKPTVADTTGYTKPNDTSYLNKEPSFINKLLVSSESDKKASSAKDSFDKYFPADEDEEFILTEN
jgi:hypothetical protein